MLMALEDIRAFLILSFRVIQQNFAPNCIFLLSIFFPPCSFLGKTTSSPESTGLRRVLKVNCCLPMEALTKKARLASIKNNCLLIGRGYCLTVGCCNENLISLKKDELKLRDDERNYTLRDPLGLGRLWLKTVSLSWGTILQVLVF